MGFSLSNLTIIVMTVIVIFCNASTKEYDWETLSVYAGPGEREDVFQKREDGSKMCIEQLENGKYHTDKDGFENFQTKVKDLKRYPRNGGTNLEDYKELAQYKIKESYKSLYEEPAYLQWSTVDKSCAKAYFCHLATHVLNPEKMLPVLTWCEIHGNGTYDAFEFLRKRDNIYKKYFRRIAKDTGFERKKQTLIYRTMDVCNKEIPKKLRNTHYNMYNQIPETDFKPSPLNWCAINVCYESLKEAGFLDVPAEQNIKGFLSKFKLTETYGYIYEFYKYLENLRTQPRDDYQIVDPIGSRIEIKVGYLRNWCGAQVCHADLINEGYIYEHVTDNYIYVLPSITKKISSGQILSKFVIDFTDYLDFTINVNPERDYIEPATYDILANISPRSPLDWCKYTVVPYNIPFQ